MAGEISRRAALHAVAGAGLAAVSSGVAASNESTEIHTTQSPGGHLFERRATCPLVQSNRWGDSRSWPVVHHDPARTGRSPTSGPDQQNVSVDWTTHVGDGELLPLVSRGGLIAAIASGPSCRTAVLNIKTGTQLWESVHDGLSTAAPVIADGELFVSHHLPRANSKDEPTAKVTKKASGTGNVSWQNTLGANRITELLAVGNVLIAGEDADSPSVVAFDQNTGKQCWELSLSKPSVTVSGIAVRDGVGYVVTKKMTDDEIDGGSCLAIDPDTGGVLWEAQFQEPLHAVSAAADKVLVRSESATCALDPRTGKHAWEVGVVGATSQPPVIAGDTAIVGGNFELVAVAIESGRLQWRQQLDGSEVRPIAGADHVYYTTSTRAGDEATVGCVDLSGAQKWVWQLGLRRTTSPILLGERLVFGSTTVPQGIPGTESYERSRSEIVALS